MERKHSEIQMIFYINKNTEKIEIFSLLKEIIITRGEHYRRTFIATHNKGCYKRVKGLTFPK